MRAHFDTLSSARQHFLCGDAAMAQVICAKCGRALAAPLPFAGTTLRVRCLSCDHVFVVDAASQQQGSADEPPKPITRLARPAGRRGPRAVNRTGRRAQTIGIASWILGIFALALGPFMPFVFGVIPPSFDWYQAVVLTLFIFSCCMAALSIIWGIIGLRHATGRRLRRAEAVVGIVSGASLILGYGCLFLWLVAIWSSLAF
jgi:hypothetical protein